MLIWWIIVYSILENQIHTGFGTVTYQSQWSSPLGQFQCCWSKKGQSSSHTDKQNYVPAYCNYMSSTTLTLNTICNIRNCEKLWKANSNMISMASILLDLTSTVDDVTSYVMVSWLNKEVKTRQRKQLMITARWRKVRIRRVTKQSSVFILGIFLLFDSFVILDNTYRCRLNFRYSHCRNVSRTKAVSVKNPVNTNWRTLKCVNTHFIFFLNASMMQVLKMASLIVWQWQ